MSGSTIGGIVGGGIGLLTGIPGGARWGFTIGSLLGGIVDPVKTKGPKLSDAQNTGAQEGMPIPFGYGTFPCGGQVVWQGDVIEHEKKSGGKGGPQQISYTYTRSYAIGICEGPVTGIQKAWRNGKLVYDISPTSTILGQNAKFLAKFTFYLGSETQTVDPTIEAAEGVGNTGPMRGLCYMVAEDDETSAGEIAQWRFVVQKCGTVSAINENAPRFIATGAAGIVERSSTGATWPDSTGGLSGVTLRNIAGERTLLAAVSSVGKFYYSTDQGANWVASTTSAFNPGGGYEIKGLAYGNNTFVAVTQVPGAPWTSTVIVSTDGGDNWTESSTSIADAAEITFGSGVFVIITGNNGSGIHTSANGTSWTLRSTIKSMLAVAWNGDNFMAVGDMGTSASSPTGTTWTAAGTSPGGANWSFQTVTGAAGYFVAGTNGGVGSLGIYKSSDLGATWVYKSAYGAYTSSTYGDGYFVFGSVATVQVSSDAGETWASYPLTASVDLAYLSRPAAWYSVPDAQNIYADADGVLQTQYSIGTQISACGATLSDIVSDLCDRAGITSAEMDVSALTDAVKGYVCGTEASAQAFIEPLTKAFFFDRGEWDKKIRFIKRGGSNAFALTTDDLLAQDGPAIGQTKVQEVELLRKVTVMTIDPAADFNSKPQNWERRIGTIQAKGESTEEIPIVTDANTAKAIARKRSNVAWSETEKFDYGLTVKWSKLTPTDVGTLTDKKGVVHRVRLTSMNEEAGVFSVEEATKDRASAYAATATGTVVTTPASTSPDLIGPTLFAAMNLPQLRSQDNVPGLWIGAAGILGGWPGCQILMSVDGGVSYATALTITEPTTMGPLTAAATSASTTLSVRAFGGTLASATAAQVLTGENLSAVLSGTVAEVFAYTTATATGTVKYDLTGLTRGIKDTLVASHAVDDQFIDIGTAYFLPITQAAGTTLYFKAVGIGLSADAITAVSLVWGGSTFVVDAGEIVGPLGLLDRAGAAIYDRAGQIINTRV